MSIDDFKKIAASLPDDPGVYYFKNGKDVLYVGKATSIRSRVRSYFSNDLQLTRGSLLVRMVSEATEIDFKQTDSVLEALIYEANEIKKLQPPYNTKEKDNKSFNWVVFTKEDYPRILVVRQRDLEQSWDPDDIKYQFGPYPNGLQLREALKIIRKIFPFSDKCRPGATTAPQLSSKTWAEIAKWTKKCITGHWFNITTGKGAMRMAHRDHPEAWYCTAQTCQEENSEAFAGQHAADSTSFYIFDEASGVPDKIWEVAEGGLTDGEPMFFAFGNPTQSTGEFRECFHSKRHRWNRQQIDSRSVQITNKAIIDEWIADHGIDSDFVKVRVRGMFPSMSAKQFIGVDDVDAAFGKHLRSSQYAFAPKILTLDPAWDGGDELVFGLRQGLHFRILAVWDKNDNDGEVANALARFEDEHEADGVIIDKGYGTGIYSFGQTMGRDWLLADFGSASPDPGCLNLRAFMWNEMKKWLKAGGAIPEDQVLYDDLIGPMTVPKANGIIQLESKEDMKRRKVPSPNRADALALSFAYPIERKARGDLVPRRPGVPMREHDPYADLARTLDAPRGEYDPYANLR